VLNAASYPAYLHVCISCTVHSKPIGHYQAWQDFAKHMKCVSTICRLEEDLPPGPLPTCAPTLPLQNTEHLPPAGTHSTPPPPPRPPQQSPLCTPMDPFQSALTYTLTHPLQPPLCRLTGPQGTFLMLHHHPLSSRGSPGRHIYHRLQQQRIACIMQKTGRTA